MRHRRLEQLPQQVLSLLETQLTFAILLYRVSLADITGWPFLCVSIGFTKVRERAALRTSFTFLSSPT